VCLEDEREESRTSDEDEDVQSRGIDETGLRNAGSKASKGSKGFRHHPPHFNVTKSPPGVYIFSERFAVHSDSFLGEREKSRTAVLGSIGSIGSIGTLRPYVHVC
jgi:hypothetical protein